MASASSSVNAAFTSDHTDRLRLRSGGVSLWAIAGHPTTALSLCGDPRDRITPWTSPSRRTRPPAPTSQHQASPRLRDGNDTKRWIPAIILGGVLLVLIVLFAVNALGGDDDDPAETTTSTLVTTSTSTTAPSTTTEATTTTSQVATTTATTAPATTTTTATTTTALDPGKHRTDRPVQPARRVRLLRGRPTRPPAAAHGDQPGQLGRGLR